MKLLKNDTFIDFPLKINLIDFVVNDNLPNSLILQSSPKKNKSKFLYYNLISVINHFGTLE